MFTSKNVVKNGASISVAAGVTNYAVTGIGVLDSFSIGSEFRRAFLVDLECSSVTTNVAATATLATTAPITLTSVATGTARNTNTFTLQVVAAAANPSNTVLATISGSATAIVLTITPNDGTNNTATPVGLTTAELVQLINSGTVTGKTVTVTDASSWLNDQTATGGDTTELADSGEGDGEVATFSGGVGSGTSVAKLQVRQNNSQTWIDSKTVTITADGTFTIKLLDTIAGDQTYLPLRPEGRIVITTGANETLTISQVLVPASC